jgi:hypothetical protein
MVAVLVPPTVLQEVKAVLDPPMIADVPEQGLGGHLARIEAGNEIAHIQRQHLAVSSANLAIDTDRDAAARHIERLADVVGVF